MSRLWVCLLACLLIGVKSDEGNGEREEEETELFVPIKFVTPTLNKKPNFFDYFPSKDDIGKQWIKSSAKKDGVDSSIAKYNGEWKIDTSTEVFIENDFGLVAATKARHHAISAKLHSFFSFETKPFIIQYEVKFEEGQECGGGYVKLLSLGAEKDLASFTDKTPYTIMFGPDKCSPNGKIHLIFRYKNPKNGSIDEYHAKQPASIDSALWDDHRTHLYTCVVHPDGSYSVQVDRRNIFSGNMLTDLIPSLQPPKEIADPEDKKPMDWDDRAEIDDESAVKPEDWDEDQPKTVMDEKAEKPSDWDENIPELIPDPEAEKPTDWDVEMDGDWEPPLIDNPACKGLSGCGQWKRPTIPNPLYKGKWIRPKIPNANFKGAWAPRQIDNPNYFDPTAFGGLEPISAIGIELWTMSKNIIFDNILICDDEEIAKEAARQTFDVRQAEEARLAASKGQGKGIFQSMVEAAEQRPWLYVVYIACVLIPVILLGVCCFGRKSTAPSQKKKYDSFRDDEKAPKLVDEDEEVEEEEETDIIEENKESTPTTSKTSKVMQEIEDDEGETSNEEQEISEDGDESISKVEEKKENTSPKTGLTKRKARRQD